ncbi:MAG: hypothetical protein K9K32_07650 [Halanaerobiales bacterium]|nr:hypothetical protein [Halanaerobiales bacterium]
MSAYAKRKFVEAYAGGNTKEFTEGAVGMDAIEYRCLGGGLYAEISSASGKDERYAVTIVQKVYGKIEKRLDLLGYFNYWQGVEDYLEEVKHA